MPSGKLPKTLAQRSQCPIATTLDLVGDKWTLLLIRDIGLFGKHRNKEFQEAGERIPSNILADRLKRLVESGLVEKRLYQQHPPRYEYHLTEGCWPLSAPWPPGPQAMSVACGFPMWWRVRIPRAARAARRAMHAAKRA